VYSKYLYSTYLYTMHRIEVESNRINRIKYWSRYLYIRTYLLECYLLRTPYSSILRILNCTLEAKQSTRPQSPTRVRTRVLYSRVRVECCVQYLVSSYNVLASTVPEYSSRVTQRRNDATTRRRDHCTVSWNTLTLYLYRACQSTTSSSKNLTTSQTIQVMGVWEFQLVTSFF
jgi:hypothetical protein